MRRAVLFMAFMVAVAIPTRALAVTITFSEFPTGTLVSNQYAADGVTFSGDLDGLPIITDDGAMPDSPVLSPNPPYAGTFNINFTNGATGVMFDSGFWDAIGTGDINVFNTANVLVGHVTNTGLGPQHMDFSAFGDIGRIEFNSLADPAGADIDNLSFTAVPEPASLLLLGTGLLGAGLRRRKRSA